MPGIRNSPGISHYAHSLYHSDMHIPPVRHAGAHSWDPETATTFQRPSSRQKVHRPPQWLQRGKEDLQANFLGSVPAHVAPVCSNESDDLQSMVHDFIENDCVDYMDGMDSDGASPALKLTESLQMLITPCTSVERELLTEVKLLLLTINEDTDLFCNSEGSDCKGGCTKRFLVKYLKIAGYSASVCKSKWPSAGRVPGGEYEYIDVVFNGEEQPVDRLIVDLDFQAQFEIARPTQQYETALKLLPTVYVGMTSKLEEILELMSEAAKDSLKQNDMHLPPWRTLDYMSAKWLSEFERKASPVDSSFSGSCSLHFRDNRFPIPTETKQCGDQLRRTKETLFKEVNGSGLGYLPRGRSSRANMLRRTGI